MKYSRSWKYRQKMGFPTHWQKNTLQCNDDGIHNKNSSTTLSHFESSQFNAKRKLKVTQLNWRIWHSTWLHQRTHIAWHCHFAKFNVINWNSISVHEMTTSKKNGFTFICRQDNFWVLCFYIFYCSPLWRILLSLYQIASKSMRACEFMIINAFFRKLHWWW